MAAFDWHSSTITRRTPVTTDYRNTQNVRPGQDPRGPINGYVAEKVFNLGADVFIISKISPVVTNVDQFLEGQKRKDFGLEDFDAVHEGCTRCSNVAASIRFNAGKVVYGD